MPNSSPTVRERNQEKIHHREKVILNTSVKETGNKASPGRDEQRGTDGQSVNASLGLRHWNRRTLWVIKSIHCVQIHDHMEAIYENQEDNQRSQQPHPDPWREEACAVASVGEISWIVQAKALNLQCRTKKVHYLFYQNNNSNSDKHSKCIEFYLKVNKVEPPKRAVAGGIGHHEQWVPEAADGLAVVGILWRCAHALVARESCRGRAELQLHGVQGGPVPCRARIKLLTHDKTREENETAWS